MIPHFALAVAILAGPPLVLAQQPAPVAVPLEVEHPAAERSIAGGEVHAYTAALDAGQYARFVVEQRGVDIVLHLISPTGDSLLCMDSPTGDAGSEVIALAAPAPGMYRLLVRPYSDEAEAGRYQARLDEVLSAAEYALQLERERATRDAGGGERSRCEPLRTTLDAPCDVALFAPFVTVSEAAIREAPE